MEKSAFLDEKLIGRKDWRKKWSMEKKAEGKNEREKKPREKNEPEKRPR